MLWIIKNRPTKTVVYTILSKLKINSFWDLLQITFVIKIILTNDKNGNILFLFLLFWCLFIWCYYWILINVPFIGVINHFLDDGKGNLSVTIGEMISHVSNINRPIPINAKISNMHALISDVVLICCASLTISILIQQDICVWSQKSTLCAVFLEM